MVQTRRGALVQDRWPDLVAAAEARLPHGLVLDGELVVWDTEAGRLSFEALQRRVAARARGARALAARWPAYFVAFDLLQQDGQELLTPPYAERRALLEGLFSENALTAPWTLCPMTTDLAKAREWLESWPDVSGVEGILVKPLNGRYLPGYRGWTKIRRRDTTETIVGAITGTLTRPQLLVLGRHDQNGRLRAATSFRCRPGSGPRPASRGGSTPPAARPAPAASPAPATAAAPSPTLHRTCPSGSGAHGPCGRRRSRTGEPGSHTREWHKWTPPTRCPRTASTGPAGMLVGVDTLRATKRPCFHARRPPHSPDRDFPAGRTTSLAEHSGQPGSADSNTAVPIPVLSVGSRAAARAAASSSIGPQCRAPSKKDPSGSFALITMWSTAEDPALQTGVSRPPDAAAVRGRGGNPRRSSSAPVNGSVVSVT